MMNNEAQQGAISRFLFGKRLVIDKAKLNYKQLQNYEWNRVVRTITNIFYWVLYNSIIAFTWYAVATKHGDNSSAIVNSISTGGEYALLGGGTMLFNSVHWVINKFSKEKKRKDMLDNGNPIPKKSGISIAMLSISLLPLIIWLIGKIVIIIKCNKYKKINGSLETPDQKRYFDLERSKVSKDGVMEVIKELGKGLKS